MHSVSVLYSDEKSGHEVVCKPVDGKFSGQGNDVRGLRQSCFPSISVTLE